MVRAAEPWARPVVPWGAPRVPLPAFICKFYVVSAAGERNRPWGGAAPGPGGASDSVWFGFGAFGGYAFSGSASGSASVVLSLGFMAIRIAAPTSEPITMSMQNQSGSVVAKQTMKPPCGT